MKKTILIFGGTGLIGTHLIHELKNNYKVIVLSRNPAKAEQKPPLVEFKSYDADIHEELVPLFEEADGVINLAGQNIGEKRWTNSFKNKILESRIEMGNLIRKAFEKTENKPEFFIQGSASGYYGINPSDAEVTEERPSTRDSFLTNVAVKAEENVADLSKITRLVFIRTGIVLDKNGGALPKMALPFRLFVGGTVWSGKQWMPWIHMEDEIKAIRFAIENKTLIGAVNLTAPFPVRQKTFAKALGKTLKRPSFFPAPAFMLKLILGKERAKDLLLSGLRVVPDKLLKAGFSFQFDTINKALNDIYSNS